LDSLTQIVLGAATGELVLGRKLGNRAMIWGGIAGTIPDLDVIVSAFVSPTTNLHVHRGLSHSIFFLFALSFLMAWLTTKMYPEGKSLRDTTWYKWIAIAFRIVFTLLLTSFLSFMLYYFIDEGWIKWSLISTIVALTLMYITKMYQNYSKEFYSFEHVSYKEWVVFFLFTLITHPLLDCFTVYGTQIFSPFSNMRVSWDNISVADPMYTVALGLPIWLASFYLRKSRTRNILLIIGVVLSSAYMMTTIVNKSRVNKILATSIEKQGIKAEMSMTNPTIFNSILWSGTVKTQDSLYSGVYSLLDRNKVFELEGFPINEYLLADTPADDYTVETIKWFSKGYYVVSKSNPDTLKMSDLRYGSFGNRSKEKPNEFIFNFNLYKDKDNNWQIDRKSQRGPSENPRDIFVTLFRRMLGK
jgi:inner membrane protein